MEIDYYDRVHKETTKVEVNTKVSYFLEKEKQKNKKLSPEEIKKLGPRTKRDYYQREFERSVSSLDELLDNGFQPSSHRTIEDEIIARYKERKYLNSPEYKQFRNSLRQELVRVFAIMPPYLKQVMFLRFFREMSLSQIADCLNFTKSTAQSYVSRGCAYIKDFLESDIAEQDKKEREEKEKRARERARRIEEQKELSAQKNVQFSKKR